MKDSHHDPHPVIDAETIRRRFIGCLLGGAVGDALGAPVEFMKVAMIRNRFGPQGITDYATAYGGLGKVTDDTQMTLFTAEGLLRSNVRGSLKGIASVQGMVAKAYQRWLRTQERESVVTDDCVNSGWLIEQIELHNQRAPGLTCLSALRASATTRDPVVNDSKGCGGVMRVAPAGLFSLAIGNTPEESFGLGCEIAALTHGHPTGKLAAGAFAMLIHLVTSGVAIAPAVTTVTRYAHDLPDSAETCVALSNALRLAGTSLATDDAIAQLGLGWVAEEALAIAVFCVLQATDFRHGVVLAVNHDGDSDSTGSLAGNLLGAIHGEVSIPDRWLAPLELHSVIREIANDLFDFPGWNLSKDEDRKRIWEKYPGY